ncbi:hypothetical protein ABT001_05530 [Streptomyces sp. NPDC002793]|uniref:hypothetical protein n=1 Tax=Streptomyces sp. NPDC002793 TaxID=3154432 RepID=UPI0033180292
MQMVILRRNNGGETVPLTQTRAEGYLTELLTRQRKRNRLGPLMRSLSKAFDGRGLPTGRYRYNGFPVRHASAGRDGAGVTLFYYVQNDTLKLFAMGEHMEGRANVTKYRITIYGQSGSDFDMDSIIAI